MEETKNKVLFFKKEIKIEHTNSESAQAVVFFGRETDMGVRVVLKQYKGEAFDGIFRELKMFTYMENRKNSQLDQDIAEVAT